MAWVYDYPGERVLLTQARLNRPGMSGDLLV
jgi:hypothetical protein